MPVKAYPNPKGWPGFRTIFRHPVTQKTSSFGLDTTDRETADRYCQQLQAFIDDATLLKDAKSPRLLAYARRVREIIFGKDAAAKLDAMKDKPKLADSDIDELETVVVALIQRAKTQEQLIKLVCQSLREFESTRYKELNTELQRVQEKLADKTARCTDLENELANVRRAANLHVANKTIKTAYNDWQATQDFKALAPKTQKEAGYACESFLATTDKAGATVADMKLADLRGQHVTAWLNTVKSKPDEDGNRRELSAVTRAKMKRYVSIFVSHTYRTEDLSENPMEKTGVVKGAGTAGEDIEAITHLDDFNEMLQTLSKIKPAPEKKIDVEYWRALVTTAALTGPRYSELAWLKLDNVNLEANDIFIGKREGVDGKKTGTKTGRSRHVPIETTTLREILVAHVARRKQEQKRTDATPAQKSDFLFPSTVADNPFKPRTLTPAGMWSDNGVFQDAWDEVRKECEAVTGKREFWRYGPRQWRHCAGTCMGYSGNDTWRISDWLGTGEQMVEDHYRQKSKTGKVWPFKW